MLDRKTLHQQITGYAFILPWLCALVFFIGFPFIAGLFFSFCDYPPLKTPLFIGLDNYAELATDKLFHRSLGVTMIFAAVSIPLGVILAMTLAMLLNARIRGQSFYRVVYYLPHLVPGVVTALLWLWLLNPDYGLINLGLGAIMSGLDWWAGLFFDLDAAARGSAGFVRFTAVALLVFPLLAYLVARQRSGPATSRSARALTRTVVGLGTAASVLPVLTAVVTSLMPQDMKKLHAPGWLSDGNPMPGGISFAPSWAMWALIVMGMWGVGQMALIYLAKLQDVPQELYEAADLDGATWWGKTRHVTIPMISPIILFNVVMAIIGTFQVFDAPYIMTGGGPEDKTRFLAMFVYEQAFQYQRVGYASAVAWVLFVVIVCLTMLAFRLSRRYVFYQGR